MLYRLIGWLRARTVRCLVCDRLFLLHTPWQEYRHYRVPLPIELTDQAHALLAAGPQATREWLHTADQTLREQAKQAVGR
jgi:hypothetical protein